MTKLVIIEDDPILSRMHQRIFRLAGYEVDHANDGVEGLEKVRSSKPDVILLDVVMPKMNGLQVLEELKLDPTTRDIPVIMLTNLGGRHHVEIALSKGAASHIFKSGHELEEIVTMVKEVLSNHVRENELT